MSAGRLPVAELRTWDAEVRAFKRDLLTARLAAHKGNRSAAARTLGLQRTYIHRLIRELGVAVPSPARIVCPECLASLLPSVPFCRCGWPNGGMAP